MKDELILAASWALQALEESTPHKGRESFHKKALEGLAAALKKNQEPKTGPLNGLFDEDPLDPLRDLFNTLKPKS